MGYAMCMGRCFNCNQMFSFNPIRVPSIRVDGVRQPICAACVEKANPLRVANGLEPIVPHKDAYTYCNEEELDGAP
jgi:hypothetical protein